MNRIYLRSFFATAALCSTLFVHDAMALSFENSQQADGFETEKKEVKKKKIKENLLDKTKWEKKNYDSFKRRRKKNGLPEQLHLAPFDDLKRDPTLEGSDITGYFENKPVTDAIRLSVVDLTKAVPATLPDMNIILSGSPEFSPSASETGQIILRAGMFDKLNTEDEFMFLLGHEAAHIALDHYKNKENRESLKTAVTIGVFIAKGANMEQTQRSDELLGTYAVTDFLVGPAWNRSDEDRADELAIDFIIREGYSTEGAIHIMESLKEAEEQREAERKLRCKNTGGLLGQLLSSKPVPPECNVIKKLASSILSILSSHPSASKRLENIQEYITTRYPDYHPPASRNMPDNLASLFDKNGPFLRSSYAQRAIKAYYDNEIDIGNRYTALAYDENDVQTPAPRLAKYHQLKRYGEHQAAVRQLELIYNAGTASRVMYLLLMNEWEASIPATDLAQKVMAYRAEAKAYETAPIVDRAQFLAETQALEKERHLTKIENDNSPKVYQLIDPGLSATALEKYDRILALIDEAKSRFPSKNEEFLYKELEVLKYLARENDLLTAAQECKGSLNKQVSKHCKGVEKEILSLRKKRKQQKKKEQATKKAALSALQSG